MLAFSNSRSSRAFRFINNLFPQIEDLISRNYFTSHHKGFMAKLSDRKVRWIIRQKLREWVLVRRDRIDPGAFPLEGWEALEGLQVLKRPQEKAKAPMEMELVK
jgi:hypothetical protein